MGISNLVLHMDNSLGVTKEFPEVIQYKIKNPA